METGGIACLNSRTYHFNTHFQKYIENYFDYKYDIKNSVKCISVCCKNLYFHW